MDISIASLHFDKCHILSALAFVLSWWQCNCWWIVHYLIREVLTFNTVNIHHTVSWSPNSTDLYFWYLFRWSTQKYKYEEQRSSCWAINYHTVGMYFLIFTGNRDDIEWHVPWDHIIQYTLFSLGTVLENTALVCFDTHPRANIRHAENIDNSPEIIEAQCRHLQAGKASSHRLYDSDKT